MMATPLRPAVKLLARSVTLSTAQPFVISSTWRKARSGKIGALARRAARRLGWATARASVVHVELRVDGHVGFGEGRPLSRHGESVRSALGFLASAARAFADAPRDAMEDRAAIVRRIAALDPGQRAARAALDAALHDLDGRRAGIPVWRLLGLARRGPPTSYTISLTDPDSMARNAEQAASLVHALKLKLGGGDGLDADRVRAVRRAVALPLRVDANEGWGFEEALELLPALAGLGVELVEQPLPAGDADGERLRDRSPLPLFADEECRTAEDVEWCARRAHGVNIKLSKCGGISEALRCVAAARARGLRTMIGCMIESSLGIAAAAHIASCFDYADLDSNLLLERDPFEGMQLVDGVQLPAEGAGLGVQPAGDR